MLSSLSVKPVRSVYYSSTETRVSSDFFSQLQGDKSSLKAGKDEDSLIQFVAVVEPLADITQKVLSILDVSRSSLHERNSNSSA
jgi:hypothetical protein